MTDYRGVTWRVNYGEISEREQFRVGYVGMSTFDAYFEVNQLSDLIATLTAVAGLGLGQVSRGVGIQAVKVSDGASTSVSVAPRLDTGTPVEKLRVKATDLPDLLYALGLFQIGLGTSALPDDWNSDRPGIVPEKALPERLSESALKATIATTIGSVFGVVPLTEFIFDGETLNVDDSGFGNNIAIWQRVIDQCHAWFLADGKPRKIQPPQYVTMRFGVQGNEPLLGAAYSLRWRSGVGIATNGDPSSVVFKPVGNTNMFHGAKSFGTLEYIYVDAHTVDGSEQTRTTYNAACKGWFLQDVNHARFRDIYMLNIFATGFGCDFLRDTIVTGVARNCGRGLKDLGIDPLTTSGGSGFGIGTGLHEIEDFTLDVAAYDCGFHGVFTETQKSYREEGDLAVQFSRGSRIRAYVSGNFVGFRDCGSDGLVSEITGLGNLYAEILHDGTVLAPQAGINGRCRAEISGGLDGLVIGAASAGAYSFEISTHHHSGDGVTTKTGGAIPPHLSIRGESHHNGGRGVHIGLPSTDLVLDMRTWENESGGLALLGAGNIAVAPQISGDFRDDGATVEQQIAGQFRIDARGLSATAPYGLTLTASGSTSLVADWEAPLVNDGITDYTVQYRKVGDTAWTTFAHSASTATTQTITGFAAGDRYEVRVAAVTGAGTSSFATAFGWTGQLLTGDTFNRPDTAYGADLLGTMDSGSAPAAWAGGSGWGVKNQRASVDVTSANAVSTDTGVAVRTVEFTLTALGEATTLQVPVRWSGSSSSMIAVSRLSSTGTWGLIKSNSSTTVLLDTGVAVGVGDTVRAVCAAGGVYRVFVNGNYRGSATDAHLSAETRIALRAVRPVSIDNVMIYA